MDRIKGVVRGIREIIATAGIRERKEQMWVYRQSNKIFDRTSIIDQKWQSFETVLPKCNKIIRHK